MIVRMIRSALVALLTAAVGQARAQSTSPRSIVLSPPNASLPTEFTLVSAVRELSDGRLLIVDWSEKKLLIADWAKEDVAQLGRNGSGPGEYLQPSALLALGGDSTVLPDLRNGRWLLLDGAAIAATLGPDTPAIRSGARAPHGADTRGHVIFNAGIGVPARSAGPMPRRDSVLLFRVARASGHTDTVAALKARPTMIKVEGPAERPTSISVLTNPLAAGELAALFPDGWIAIARLDPYRVDWIAPNGARTLGSPLPFDRVRLDQREQRAFAARQAVRSGRSARDPNSFPEWPEIIPPFLSEALLAAPDGRLWIRRVPTAANPQPPYDVVDRRGVLVARVTAGTNVQVVGFGQASAYTVATDENGIQQLQRRPLPKS
jgi:hypothetical protein